MSTEIHSGSRPAPGTQMVTIAGPAGLVIERPAGPPPLTPGAAVRLLAALGLDTRRDPGANRGLASSPHAHDDEKGRPDGTP